MRTISTEWCGLEKGYRLVTQLELDLQVHLTRSLNAAQRRKDAGKSAGGTEQSPPLDISLPWWRKIAFVPPKVQEKAGDQGEWELLSFLQSKLPDTYYAVTKVLVAKSLDADVIVVGPTGIWVLESKYWSGKITDRLGQWHQTKTYHQPGGTLNSKDKDASSFDLQWLMEKNAVMNLIATRFPKFGLDIYGGLAFTQPNVELEIDDTSRARYGNAEYWAGRIQGSSTITELTTDMQLQIIDALMNLHDSFKANQNRASASALAQALYDATVQKAEVFITENCQGRPGLR